MKSETPYLTLLYQASSMLGPLGVEVYDDVFNVLGLGWWDALPENIFAQAAGKTE